jgi:hypothetical protein
METIPFLVTLPAQDTENDEMSIFGAFRSDGPVVSEHIPAERCGEPY